MTYDSRTEQRLINEIMELLVTHYGGGMSEAELDLSIDSLHRALRVAGDSHAGVFRKSGEPYFFHPLRVAHLAARHWMDFASVMAAILHDVVEDTPVTLTEIEADFGPEVALLVNGLTKAADDNVSREILKAETYRKQLLVAIEDVRVLCLKFWDRIDNLQTIGALKPEKQSLIAEETRSVYVPLASHLGMGYVASELDALSLKILYPRRANFEGLMRSLLEGESAFDTQSLRLASASIQVYTPLGDTRTLPEGSSALDLAFDIHEELGLRAMRARINGQTRPLKSRLMDGDQVGIEQSESPQVLPKWLEWAVTPRARNAIRRYLRSKV